MTATAKPSAQGVLGPQTFVEKVCAALSFTSCHQTIRDKKRYWRKSVKTSHLGALSYNATCQSVVVVD